LRGPAGPVVTKNDSPGVDTVKVLLLRADSVACNETESSLPANCRPLEEMLYPGEGAGIYPAK